MQFVYSVYASDSGMLQSFRGTAAIILPSIRPDFKPGRNEMAVEEHRHGAMGHLILDVRLDYRLASAIFARRPSRVEANSGTSALTLFQSMNACWSDMKNARVSSFVSNL